VPAEKLIACDIVAFVPALPKNASKVPLCGLTLFTPVRLTLPVSVHRSSCRSQTRHSSIQPHGPVLWLQAQRQLQRQGMEAYSLSA
jgi:hypothetical protein